MLFGMPKEKGYGLFIERRKELLSRIREQYSEIDKGLLLFFGAFEHDAKDFRQESSFYYLTGITEPGVALATDLSGGATLFVPACVQERARWVNNPLLPSKDKAKELGLQAIEYLGDATRGYAFQPFFEVNDYKNCISLITEVIGKGGKIFTLCPNSRSGYLEQRLVIDRLKLFIPELAHALVDISSIVASMRRIKDAHEIECLYHAVGLTIVAQEAAAGAIRADVLESEVQGALEFVYTAANTIKSFPSIVATGKNGTILHYMDNHAALQNSELVVVDIGAQMDYYCADLTRTYPVSGTFSKRQREVYQIVLDTQEYIADLAQPGYWLSNSEHKDKSLNHLAQKFLEEKGYGNYFPHGIGHYLGLDVHDVGDYATPLKEGDVITIEPGIYIPAEGLGIRIEDNYWIVKGGAVCLSESLPKTLEGIEEFMRAAADYVETNKPVETDEPEIDDDEDEDPFGDEDLFDDESHARG